MHLLILNLTALRLFADIFDVCMVADDQDANAMPKRQKLSHRSDGSLMNVELWNAVADSRFWEPFDEYVEHCRINANVRQVLREGEHSLRDGDLLSN